MKALLLIAALLIAQAALVKCGDNYDGGMDLNDCAAAYMWMMMNSGPQVPGLCPSLLVFVGIAAYLFSSGSSSSVDRRVASK